MPETGSPIPPYYLIDNLIRSKEIHLISGATGSGKTTLAFQIADEWSRGEPIFGHQSHPVPFVYVACERTLPVLHDDLDSIGLDPLTFPCTSLVHPLRRERRPCFEDALNAARIVDENVRLIFLDGIASLCPGKSNDYRDVSNFLTDSARICHERLVTVIGLVYSVKAREGEGYSAPRDRIAGSLAWSAVTDTKILIEYYRPSKPKDPVRVITLLPQRRPPETFLYQFRSGRLVAMTESENALLQPVLDQWLSSVAPLAELTTQQIVDAAVDIGRSAVFLWIENQLDLGTLAKLRRGVYVKPVGTDAVQ